MLVSSVMVFAAAMALSPRIILPSPSTIRQVRVRGVDFSVKRDDQWRLTGLGAGISGNKARKLLSFAEDGNVDEVVASFGGHQSNAMVAIAALCRERGSRFVYLTKPVPKWLRQNAAGNYARALALGAEFVPLRPEDYRRLENDVDFRESLLQDFCETNRIRWIPQGGSCADAERGLRLLAEEIGENYTVVVPAGTGTTALFLARHSSCEVVAVPCATSAKTLMRQMEKLDRATGEFGKFPTLLEGTMPHRFGKPSQRELDVWNELKSCGLFLDLIYAPHTWDVLLEAVENNNLPSATNATKPPNILYIHCGGVEGVATQLTRYRHAGMIVNS